MAVVVVVGVDSLVESVSAVVDQSPDIPLGPQLLPLKLIIKIFK